MEYVFIIALVLALLLFFHNTTTTNSSSKHDAEKAKDSAFACELKYNDMHRLVNSNIQSVGECNIKIRSLISMVESLNKLCHDVSATHSTNAHKYIELYDKQMQLQDKLSNKRPVITIGKGIEALIKESSKKSKKLERV